VTPKQDMQNRLLVGVFSVLSVLCLVGFSRLGCSLLARSRETDSAREQQRPVAVLEWTEYDFGTFEAGPTLQARFPLRNDGARRLIVMEKSRSCECVSGRRREIILEHGESTELEAVLQTRGLRSNVRLELDYTTSDPQLPQFRLTVIADIISPSPKVR